MSKNRTQLETFTVQAGHYVDPATGAVVPPIQPSSTFARNEDYSLQLDYSYSRAGNPALDQAEKILAEGDADMVSMARPFLADADLVQKAIEDRAQEINTCIGCNQACLDHTFSGKLTSCLVNPRACHETELNYVKTSEPRRIAVVGGGPAGLAFATVAAERGHAVTLFDDAKEIGGQFNVAKRIPGKEEFFGLEWCCCGGLV